MQVPYTPKPVSSRYTLGPGDMGLAWPQSPSDGLSALWDPLTLQLLGQDPLLKRQSKPGPLGPARSKAGGRGGAVSLGLSILAVLDEQHGKADGMHRPVGFPLALCTAAKGPTS